MPPETLAREEGERLHQRLAAGDATAPAEIAVRCPDALIDYLRRRFPNLSDPHLADTAAIDALFSYLKRPGQFDPRRMSLARYLRMSARGDLFNALKAQQADLTVALAHPAQAPDGAAPEGAIGAGHDLTVEEQVFIRLSTIWERLHELVSDAVDWEIVLLMMEGERSTEAYAAVLGLQARPAEAKAAEVKRHKERLRKHLRRHLLRSELSDDER